jgi:hypothetical protein
MGEMRSVGLYKNLKTLKGRDHMGVDKRIILIRILKKCDVRL